MDYYRNYPKYQNYQSYLNYQNYRILLESSDLVVLVARIKMKMPCFQGLYQNYQNYQP